MSSAKNKPPPTDLSDADTQALLRWRLALGPSAESVAPQFGLDGLCGGASGTMFGLPRERIGELDEALDFVYDEKKGGSAGSRP
jgi:hypothetical protein